MVVWNVFWKTVWTHYRHFSFRTWLIKTFFKCFEHKFVKTISARTVIVYMQTEVQYFSMQNVLPELFYINAQVRTL